MHNRYIINKNQIILIDDEGDVDFISLVDNFEDILILENQIEYLECSVITNDKKIACLELDNRRMLLSLEDEKKVQKMFTNNIIKKNSKKIDYLKLVNELLKLEVNRKKLKLSELKNNSKKMNFHKDYSMDKKVNDKFEIKYVKFYLKVVRNYVRNRDEYIRCYEDKSLCFKNYLRCGQFEPGVIIESLIKYDLEKNMKVDSKKMVKGRKNVDN